MFTGIIEGLGSIERIESEGARIVLELAVAPELAEGVRLGDSIALNGVCLTVTTVAEAGLSFQAIPETLRCSSLGDRGLGDRVNLERALRADSRLDGHIVQGHVDGPGTVRDLQHKGEDVILRVDCEKEMAQQLIPKGSIAVDGVSLTVVDPDERGFSVALIPHTLSHTTLGDRKSGDRVNLELDVLGKYIHHYLERHRS